MAEMGSRGFLLRNRRLVSWLFMNPFGVFPSKTQEWLAISFSRVLTVWTRKLRQTGQSDLPRITQIVSVRLDLTSGLPDSKTSALSTAVPSSCPMPL